MPDLEKVIKELTEIYDEAYDRWVHRPYIGDKLITLIRDNIPDALTLLREQEPRELTKDEWQMWKKDQRRNPICMVFEGDTTPFWVLYPEEVNELLYFMGKIKLFTNKPEKGTVKWGD